MLLFISGIAATAVVEVMLMLMAAFSFGAIMASIGAADQLIKWGSISFGLLVGLGALNPLLRLFF